MLEPQEIEDERALLAALVGVMPKARRQGLRLLVTPETIVRWHRDIVQRRWAAPSMREQYRVRRQPRIGATINEYRLVA